MNELFWGWLFCSLLVTSYFLLITSYSLLLYSLLVTFCSLFFIRYSLPFYSLLVAFLLITLYSLLFYSLLFLTLPYVFIFAPAAQLAYFPWLAWWMNCCIRMLCHLTVTIWSFCLSTCFIRSVPFSEYRSWSESWSYVWRLEKWIALGLPIMEMWMLRALLGSSTAIVTLIK